MKPEELYPILLSLKEPYHQRNGIIYIHPKDLKIFLYDSHFLLKPSRKRIGFYWGQEIRIQDDIFQILLPLINSKLRRGEK